MLDTLRFNPLPPSLLRPQPWLREKNPITLSNNKVNLIYYIILYYIIFLSFLECYKAFSTEILPNHEES